MKKMQIDRFVEELAVLIWDGEKALNIPRAAFPFEVNEGDIIELEWDGVSLSHARLLIEETEAAKAHAKSLMERLKARQKK